MATVEVDVELLREGVQMGAEAAALGEKVAADQAAIEAKAPLVLDALVEHGVVDSHDKEAALGWLKDPNKTLDLVAKLAKRAAVPRRMGSGTSEKLARAEHDPQFPAPKESDRVFAETLGQVEPVSGI